MPQLNLTLEKNSPLHLPLKPDAVFKKQRASKVPIHLPDKINRLLDIRLLKKNSQKETTLLTLLLFSPKENN